MEVAIRGKVDLKELTEFYRNALEARSIDMDSTTLTLTFPYEYYPRVVNCELTGVDKEILKDIEYDVLLAYIYRINED